MPPYSLWQFQTRCGSFGGQSIGSAAFLEKLKPGLLNLRSRCRLQVSPASGVTTVVPLPGAQNRVTLEARTTKRWTEKWDERVQY